MKEEPPQERCLHCGNIMQVAHTVYKEEKLVSVQYVCGCRVPAFWKNVHPFKDAA